MSPLDPLSALAVKFGSDKWSSKHSYTAWYYDTFKDRRETVRKVVEIGVGEGASLRMWREFFPNAYILGMDIDPRRVFADGRIEVVQGNQGVRPDLETLIEWTGTDIDLFVDDGSHLGTDQLLTCLTVMKLLARGVTYVIEDAVNYDIPIRGYDVHTPVLEHRNRYDNRLIVVTHRAQG